MTTEDRIGYNIRYNEAKLPGRADRLKTLSESIMATVKRLKVVRWYLTDATDATMRRNVPARTPGAVKVTEEGSTYFVVWKVGGKTMREATGLTDKRAAQAYLAQWITAREHGRTGLLDPYRKHLDRATEDHLADYLVTLRDLSDAHRREVERVCRLFIQTAGVTKLRDFTPARVTEYLTAHAASASTRNKHRVYLSGFCSFLFSGDRIPSNPIDRVERPRAGAAEPESRTRRSYTVDELRRLMTSAREYPPPAMSPFLSGQVPGIAVWVFVSVPPFRMEAKPIVPRWRRLYRLAYQQNPSRQKEAKWSPPGPLFDAFVVGLFLVLAIGYMA